MEPPFYFRDKGRAIKSTGLGKMNAKQWKTIYWLQVGFFLCVFALCAMNGWEKTAWFAVLPIGIIYSALLRRKKFSD